MPTDDVQEVRNRINIVDLIAEDIQLKKTGRTYKGLCPFHQEKTPSFYVDPLKQLFYCFGCGEGGDMFTYITKRDQLDFSQALEYLADKAGYQLSKKKEFGSGKKQIYEINALAAKFYHAALKSTKGKQAVAYLKKRGLNQTIVDQFLLGFSPDSQNCLRFLLKKGFKQLDLEKAGLLLKTASGISDRFKYRLIFPIQDFQGRFVGFGARALGDALPKYVNSPETVLFKKSHLLYGLPQGKDEILKTETAVLVEGYIDLLMLVQAGIKNVVATLGTAFTLEHLNFLNRYVQKLILVFDGDEAGQKAAQRCQQFLAQLEEVQLYVLVLPEELDPADYLSKYGKENFQQLLKQAKPLFVFLLERLAAMYDLSNPEAKISLAKQTVKLLAMLSSPLSREQYLKQAAELLGISYEVLAFELRNFQTKKQNSSLKEKLEITADPFSATRQAVEREILKLMLKYPEKIAAFKEIPEVLWQTPEHLRLFTVLKQFGTAKATSVVNQFGELEKKLYAKLSLETNKVNYNEQEIDNYLKQLKNKLKQSHLELQIEQLKKKLETINKNDKSYDEIFKKLVSLEFERHKIKMEAR